MRVVILNSARKFIGEAAHCLDLARELGRRGHQAMLVVRENSELAERAQSSQIESVAFHFTSSFSPTHDLKDITDLLKLIRRWCPDIVHCHRGKDHWIAASAKILFPFLVPPLVRTRHVTVPIAQHAFNRFLFSHLTKHTIAVSQAAAMSLGAIGTRLGDRLHVVYSAVDTERFSPSHRSLHVRSELGLQSGEQLVGLIARIQNIKGQRVFLRAAAEVAKKCPHARFLIAGRGSEHKFEALRAFATSLGLGEQVIFKSWLSNLPQVLASLDVSVIASLGSEGSSRIAYESMASGVPLVATTVGCLPEIVSHNETGLLVPPADESALAHAICTLLSDNSLATRLAQNALKRVQTFHNYDRWVNEILSVYRASLLSSEGVE